MQIWITRIVIKFKDGMTMAYKPVKTKTSINQYFNYLPW